MLNEWIKIIDQIVFQFRLQFCRSQDPPVSMLSHMVNEIRDTRSEMIMYHTSVDIWSCIMKIELNVQKSIKSLIFAVCDRKYRSQHLQNSKFKGVKLQSRFWAKIWKFCINICFFTLKKMWTVLSLVIIRTTKNEQSVQTYC